MSDDTNAWLAETVRLRRRAIDAEADRDRLRAAVDAVHEALRTMEASGDHITPSHLHHVEDHIVQLTVLAIRSVLAAASPTCTADTEDDGGLTHGRT